MKASSKSPIFSLVAIIAAVGQLFVAGGAYGAGGVNGVQSGAVKLFLLYPNYRGYLFDDWPQTIKIEVSTAAPKGSITLNLVNAANAVVASRTVAAAHDQTVTLNARGLAYGTYQLEVAGQAPAYTIIKARASARAGMKAYIDPDNVLHHGGRAVFPVGVYDMPKPACAGATFKWRANLALIRRAPISGYLPVSSANCEVSDFNAQAQALRKHMMINFAALSSIYAGDKFFPYSLAFSLGLHPGNPATAEDAVKLGATFAKAVAANPTILGYYNYDEPTDAQQPMILKQYLAVKANDTASIQWPLINVATVTWKRPGCMRAPYYAPNGDPPQSDPCTDLSNWRDTGDVMGTDPLATNGWNFDANGNYWLPEVADWINDLRYATRNARPVWAVLQFYAGQSGFPGYPHWPTYQELHDMTYIAVVAGAKGIWYWSWGNLNLPLPAGAPDPTVEIGYLHRVVNDLAPLEPVILTPDAKVLARNSRHGIVRTLEKVAANGDRYVFAYNSDAGPVSVTFTLTATATTVSVVGGESRSLKLNSTGTRFSDSFKTYEAHVYKISSRAVPSTAFSIPSTGPAQRPRLGN